MLGIGRAELFLPWMPEGLALDASVGLLTFGLVAATKPHVRSRAD